MRVLRYWKIDYSAVHDGPGIRTAVYFKGCPLRCLWYANPEGQSYEDSLLYKADRCTACLACLSACPKQAVGLGTDGKIKRDRALCTACGACAETCPQKAVEIVGKEIGAEELLRELERSRPLYRRSGGGATFTGGEPLRQGRELVGLIRRCRAAGIHTVLETCGCAENKLLREAAGQLDWIYFDLKHMDPAEHIRLTGLSNDLILRNLSTASEIMGERGKTLVVRLVVVPGLSDGENLRTAAEALSRLPFLSGVELLRYHNFGMQKYEQLSRPYSLADTPPAAQEDIARQSAWFADAGLTVLPN
jgi:pyruvate formate lyase activating enzyme